MAYHIALFQNGSRANVLTANPAAQRDTYFITPDKSQKPGNNVLINKGSWRSYDAAFPQANFIYTGTDAYCFWDTGESQIAAVTEKEPSKVLLIFSGSAGDLVLTVKADGSIVFAKTK